MSVEEIPKSKIEATDVDYAENNEFTLESHTQETPNTTNEHINLDNKESSERLAKILHIGKRAVQSMIIAGELGPANELIRYGAFAASQVASSNPLIGAAVLGGTTLVVEGGAALASADIISKSGDGRILGWMHNKMSKFFKHPPKKPSPVTEAALAMAGGTVVVNAAQQIADPTRSTAENRKHGLKVAGYMSAYFTAEGALMSKGVETLGVYKTVGASILALAGTQLIFNKIISEIKDVKSYKKYADYRDENDLEVRLGIFGEDLINALDNPETIFIKNNKKSSPEFPMLVSVDDLEWYNQDFLRKKYGNSVHAFAYVHPPIYNAKTFKKALDLIKNKLDEGHVIISDIYNNNSLSPISQLIKEAGSRNSIYEVEAFGGTTESRVDVFVAPVSINKNSAPVSALNLFDTYNLMIESGEIKYDSQNGTTMVDIIEGDDAEKIWDIYEKPFMGLGENDPTYAGFTKEGLLELLKDPDVIKIINKSDGEITTLLMLMQNFENAPWFNSEYYKRNYPEYFKTNNIFMFPGIVTDEKKRGLDYATDTLKLATDVIAKRGSNILVTFECTEISSTYIPKIVEQVVNSSGKLTVSELDKPKSVINYFAIKKN